MSVYKLTIESPFLVNCTANHDLSKQRLLEMDQCLELEDNKKRRDAEKENPSSRKRQRRYNVAPLQQSGVDNVEVVPIDDRSSFRIPERQPERKRHYCTRTIICGVAIRSLDQKTLYGVAHTHKEAARWMHVDTC